MATRLDITDPIWRGDTIEIPFTLKDELAAPISLEGATVVFTLKLDPTVDDVDADVYYTKAVDDPDTDGAAGLHTIRLERTDTDDLTTADHTYQIKVIYPNTPEDDEITYVYGTVPVEDS
jgi:hypothetical protein